VAKIADFGSAIFVDSDDQQSTSTYLTTPCGTAGYIGLKFLCTLEYVLLMESFTFV